MNKHEKLFKQNFFIFKFPIKMITCKFFPGQIFIEINA